MKFKFWTKIVLALMVLTLVGGCIFLPQKPGYVKILIYNGDDNSPSGAVNAMETLFVGIDGLKALERYKITINDSSDNTLATFELNATEDGKLPPTAMWPDAGLPPLNESNNGPAHPDADLQVGSYKIILTGPDTDVTFPFSVITRNTPIIWSSNADCSIQNAFTEGDTVYVAGKNFQANTDVDIYVMRDKSVWTDMDILESAGGYAMKQFKTDNEGYIGVRDVNGKLINGISLGVAAIDTVNGNCMAFDVVVDVNRNGRYDVAKDAVYSKAITGFVVQEAPPIPIDPGDLDPEDPPIPPNSVVRVMQIASNGYALDYTTHWNDEFYYPDEYLKDGSSTRWNAGIFAIFNPLLDDITSGISDWSQVQVWVVDRSQFDPTDPSTYDLTGDDVSDWNGKPDLISVMRTCSNGAGAIIIWNAPLEHRNNSTASGQGYVVIIERPNIGTEYTFDNKYNPNTDYIDGMLNYPPDGVAFQGLRVIE